MSALMLLARTARAGEWWGLCRKHEWSPPRVHECCHILQFSSLLICDKITSDIKYVSTHAPCAHRTGGRMVGTMQKTRMEPAAGA